LIQSQQAEGVGGGEGEEEGWIGVRGHQLNMHRFKRVESELEQKLAPGGTFFSVNHEKMQLRAKEIPPDNSGYSLVQCIFPGQFMYCFLKK
jgi:hypothetical protein